MSRKKAKATDDDSKQGASRHAFGHDILTAYDGEGAWSVKIYYDDVLRQTIGGLRFEGDARWAGEDWAHLNRVLVPEAKLIGREFHPIVYGEKGVELARLGSRPTEAEARDYATQYIEQLRAVDREKVAKKQEARAEYILKMEEFDLVEENLEQKIASFKEALKLAQERRVEWIKGSRDPQIELSFVYDRKRGRQADIEDVVTRLGDLPTKSGPVTVGGVLLNDLLEDASRTASDDAKGKDKGRKVPPRPDADDSEART